MLFRSFLFTGDDVFKRIDTLSGGERGRLSLAKLMLSESNFLILDEPTNHLDITSKEILEDAINAYEGTVLFVSHYRYFINRTASRILELSSHTLTSYLGNYDYYLEKKDTALNNRLTGSLSAPKEQEAPSPTKLDWQARKEQQAKERKRENDLKKCEAAIADLEGQIARIEDLMVMPEIAVDVAKLQELTAKQEELSGKLLTLYDQWETLAD